MLQFQACFISSENKGINDYVRSDVGGLASRCVKTVNTLPAINSALRSWQVCTKTLLVTDKVASIDSILNWKECGP